MKSVITILIIAIISACGFVAYKIQKNGGGLSGILATVLGESEETLENLEPIQILIMGISGVDDYKLADSIMIASYNPKDQTASLMSIPRDTYVGKKDRKTATQNYLASYKINTVFRNGTNIPEAIDRINALTGLDLENYVIIDTNALIKLVDAIGGVTFNVPIDMDYDDDSQNLHIKLTAGEQLIDGAKAEQLLRFRHNNDGSTYPYEYGQQDIGRMRTQREFIAATLKQTLKAQNIFKIKQIMDIMAENVTTNLDISTLKSYVPRVVEFNVDNLNTGVLPGESEMCNGVSIYVANKTKTDELVAELFPKTEIIEEEKAVNNVSDNGASGSTRNTNTSSTTTGNTNNTSNTNASSSSSNAKVKIEVLNGSGSDSKLNEVVSKLKTKGYTVTKQGTTNAVNKTSIINRTQQSDSIISNIKEMLEVESSSKGTNTSDVDITIIIGKDY